MKNLFRVLPLLIGAAAFLGGFGLTCLPVKAAEQITQDAGGLHIGDGTADKIGFNGATPSAQRSGAAQAAITDNTTGSATGTLQPGVGVSTICLHVVLSKVSVADILSAYVPGYKFKLLSATFVVTNPVTTTAKAATVGLKITGVGVTGGAIALTSANCTPLGALVAGSTITALNTGAATDSITISATSVTTFVEGEGMVFLKIQNMDHADAEASQTSLINEIRAALVAKGLIKGSS